jgi:hypothetical protein
MIDIIKDYLTNLEEEELFQLFKKTKRFSSIVYRSDDDKDVIDWYVPKLDLYMEGKCRDDAYTNLLMERPKYNNLMKQKNCWYVCSTPDGIFAFDLQEYTKKYGVPKFHIEQHNKTSRFTDKRKVDKWVHYLPIDERIVLTPELLLFPFDKNYYL